MLTYKGSPVLRIQFMWQRDWKEAMYFVDTPKESCIVPVSSIASPGGIREVMRIASETRGNMLPIGEV